MTPASEEAAAPSPEQAVELRGKPPQVMRLSRKAIGIGSACGLALVGGALIYALMPSDVAEREELYNTEGIAVADGVSGAPRDYGEVPKLGPPLPGDLGGPILDAHRRGDVAELPPIGAPVPGAAPPTPQGLSQAEQAEQAGRERIAQERETARGSDLFFGSGGGRGAQVPPALADSPTGPADQVAAPPPANPGKANRREAFLARDADRRTISLERLSGAARSNVLQAGSIIPAALITGLRSDLPGLVTAQVTQNVYDSLTGRVLLIPQGSRLIGDYDAEVAFGQRRVLLAWNRLILPDGRSIVLERQPASDPSGFAGLQDGVDFHWGSVLRAALISTLLGIGSELGSGGDNDIARALRRGTQDSVGRTGEQVVSRELDVRPTLTIRPGFPVRVLVTRDLMLGPEQ